MLQLWVFLTGWSESMYSLGGGGGKTLGNSMPPIRKILENRYRVEMHDHSPIFLELGKVEKKCQKKHFFVFNKYQSVTDISTLFYKGFLKKYFLALVTKK